MVDVGVDLGGGVGGIGEGTCGVGIADTGTGEELTDAGVWVERSNEGMIGIDIRCRLVLSEIVGVVEVWLNVESRLSMVGESMLCHAGCDG